MNLTANYLELSFAKNETGTTLDVILKNNKQI